jgi:starvation-inducible DNA-binding protein
MHFTHNTLALLIRTQAVELLNRHLAAAIDLHAQVKQAHWNIRGPGFIALHLLFDRLSEQVEGYSDQLAERARALGGEAGGTLQRALAGSFLIPYEHGVGDAQLHGFAIAGSLAAFGESTRDAITHAATMGDAATADLFTEISRGIDQQLWLVESNLAAKPTD